MFTHTGYHLCRRSSWLVLTCLAAIGCRTGASPVASCCELPRPAAAFSSSDAVESHIVPPAPAPERLHMGMSAKPPAIAGEQVVASVGLGQSSDAAQFPSAAVRPPLAPAEMMLHSDRPPAPAAEVVMAKSPELEARLAALEAECRQKLVELQSLDARYQSQSEELTAVRRTLDASRSEVATLADLVSTLHQRDLASLEQLTMTLDGLLSDDDDVHPDAIDPTEQD